MNFKSILGQSVLVKSLQNTINNNMIANAYIFNGPKGCGKITAAQIFAAGINCTSKKSKPCGNCMSCEKIKKNVSIDVIHVRPKGKSIGIDQIREIIKKVSVRPYESFYRITIIDKGDLMTRESQNAFLKVLEEPEGNNIFLILTENHKTLLPTIISRCQIFNFLPVSTSVMRKYLSENYDVSKERLEFAIEKSNGIISRAIEILNEDKQESNNRFLSIIDGLIKGKKAEVICLNDELVQTKEDGMELFDFLLSLFRNVLLYKWDENRFYYTEIEKKYIKRLSEKMAEEEIFFIVDMIKEIRRGQDYNLNTKNSIDLILLKILEVLDDKSSRSTV